MKQTADIIILNARVLTLDEDRPRAEAVALADGHILAVGTAAQMEPFRGAETKVIDAAGGTGCFQGFPKTTCTCFQALPNLIISSLQV